MKNKLLAVGTMCVALLVGCTPNGNDYFYYNKRYYNTDLKTTESYVFTPTIVKQTRWGVTEDIPYEIKIKQSNNPEVFYINIYKKGVSDANGFPIGYFTDKCQTIFHAGMSVFVLLGD